MSCRTGYLRGRRSLRDLYTSFGETGGCVLAMLGADDRVITGSAVAAEAVDEAAVAFVGTLGGSGGPGDRAEEFALFRGFEAGFFAGFGFAVEGLGDGSGSALLTEGEHLDVKLAALVFNVKHVADADLAGRLCWLAVGEDALQLAGFGGLLTGLEEAGSPEPFVDASSGHAGIVVDFLDTQLDGAEHPTGKGEERSDQLECSADDKADKAEREQNQPDKREEDHGCQRQGPAEESEKTEEQEVEHRCCSSPERFNGCADEKVPWVWWMIRVWQTLGYRGSSGWIGRAIRVRGKRRKSGRGFGRLRTHL